MSGLQEGLLAKWLRCNTFEVGQHINDDFFLIHVLIEIFSIFNLELTPESGLTYVPNVGRRLPALTPLPFTKERVSILNSHKNCMLKICRRRVYVGQSRSFPPESLNFLRLA